MLQYSSSDTPDTNFEFFIFIIRYLLETPVRLYVRSVENMLGYLSALYSIESLGLKNEDLSILTRLQQMQL